MASISVEKHSATRPVTATGFFLLVLTFLPYLYTIPYYINMILQAKFSASGSLDNVLKFERIFGQASSIVFIGSHLSIPGTQYNQETGEVSFPLH